MNCLKIILKSLFSSATNAVLPFFSSLKSAVKYPQTKIEKNGKIFDSFMGKMTSIGCNSIVSNSRFGDYTYVGNNCACYFVDVGKFCSIASGVRLGLHEHPVGANVSVYPAFHRPWPLARHITPAFEFQTIKRTTIGNDVWIGEGCIILSGISIGNGAVIAAGAVVSKDVPPYAIVGGIPAKLIRMRFAVEQIEKLEQIAWWDQNEDWLKNHGKEFGNIEDFVNGCS